MSSPERQFYWQCGAFLAGLAVITGAFAAHGLQGQLEALYAGKTKEVMGQTVPAATKYLEDFKTAAQYQMYHAIGLLCLAATPGPSSLRSARVAAWSFLIGIGLFSGSLYLLVLTGLTWLGAITPFGGTAFIIGWGALALTTRSPGKNSRVVQMDSQEWDSATADTVVKPNS
ncbi:MAG: DUF423 domain-containing protein [Planctomycetaceae bacterium]|nr:DUF423 domain-containing protein [Planctomycetaceae bacterium]